MLQGILIIVVFLVIAALMMTKKIPTLLALPLMAVIICIIAGVPAVGTDAEGNAIGDDVAVLDVFDQLAVKAALLGIVAVCAQYGRLEGRPVRPGADYRARQLREIVGYLGEHFTEPISLPEVASHFGLSPQYFSTFFRENFGRTFTQHINSLRIEQAARLLRETDLPVMEVGFSVGFDNFSYFIKRFRSVYGVSPSHYRKG